MITLVVWPATQTDELGDIAPGGLAFPKNIHSSESFGFSDGSVLETRGACHARVSNIEMNKGAQIQDAQF